MARPPELLSRAVRFSIAYVLSAFGYEFMTFVMTVYIYDLTGSARKVGLFIACALLARLFSPYYGSLIDRYRRGIVFFAAAIVTAVGVCLIAANHEIVWTYSIWFLVSVAAMVIMNVRTAIMNDVMPKGNYLRGNAVMLIALNIAKLLAPLAGGVIASRSSVSSLLYFTAVVYVVAAVLGLATNLPPVGDGGRRSAAKVLAHMREGLAYLLSNRDLRYLGTLGFLWRLCVGLQVSLFVVYVKEFLGRGSDGYGIFMTLIGAGSVVGSLVGPRIASRFDPRKVVFVGLIAHYASFAVLGLTRDFQVATATATLSFLIFYATTVSTHSIRDSVTPVEYRGRVYGCIVAVLTPAALVSILAGSYLAGVFGVERVLLGAGVLALMTLFVAHVQLGHPAEPARAMG
jgi:MFS family permease